MLSAQANSSPPSGTPLLTSDNNAAYVAGETFKGVTTAFVNVATATLGVDSDTVQQGELLNYDFYSVNPVIGATSPPQNPSATINPNAARAYVNSLAITIDQITAGEDIAVLLKLYNPDFATNGLAEYTTKLLIANNAADYQAGAGSFKIVNITENNYDSAHYQIYGVQAVSSTENLTGTGFSLTGNNIVTLTAAGDNYADTSDNDVFKIIKIDVTTKTVSNFDTDLNFVGKLVDGDNDSAGFNFNVHLEADSATLTGTAQSDYLTGTDAANTILGVGGNDILVGGLGADSLTGGTGNDTYIVFNGDSGITFPTADSIIGFTTGADKLSLGLSGDATAGTGNYVEAGAAVADYAAALLSANTALAALNGTSGAGTLYAFQFDGTNGYLFEDYTSDGNADQAIILVGINDPNMIAATDIFA